MIRAASLVIAVALAATACRDRGAQNAASQIQQGLQGIEATQEPTSPQRDAAVEEACRTVTEAQKDSVEARMQRMSSEMVVLDSAETHWLRCSRYEMYLRGEVSSY